MLNICDEDLVGRVLRKDNFHMNISKSYFGQRVVERSEAEDLMKKSSILNMAGKETIEMSINLKIGTRQGVKEIDSVPFLIVFKMWITTIIYKNSLSWVLGKRKVLNESELKDIQLPQSGELLGRVIKLLGSDQVLVMCTDGKTRRGRIRGKLKRRIWIRDNDVVIIAPWDFKQDERGDITWRFTLSQVEWLKNNDHLPKDF